MKLHLMLVASAALISGCLAEQGADKDTSPVDAAPAEEATPDVTVESEVDVAPEATVDVTLDAEPGTGPGRDHPTTAGSLTLVVGADGVPAQTVVPLHVDVAAGVAPPESVQWWVYFPHLPNAVQVGAGLALEFTANFVGEYTIVAEAAQGDAPLVRLSSHLLVVAGGGMHVELSWQTPGDANQTDVSGPLDIYSAGSDVDLHFLDPDANGTFFGEFDCYFANPNPAWGDASTADNPALDRDDTDGMGPEIMTLAAPAADRQYTVGVHFYDDWGYGDSFATIRIFMGGLLVEEWANVSLGMDDLWVSHHILDGVVSRNGTEPVITPNYYY